MGINGSKGRARWRAQYRAKLREQARAMGIDPEDRPAFAAWQRERAHGLWDGLRDRILCRCSGDRHARITGKEI